MPCMHVAPDSARACLRARAHTCEHARARTRKGVHVRARANAPTLASAHPRARARMREVAHARADARARGRKRACAWSQGARKRLPGCPRAGMGRRHIARSAATSCHTTGTPGCEAGVPVRSDPRVRGNVWQQDQAGRAAPEHRARATSSTRCREENRLDDELCEPPASSSGGGVRTASCRSLVLPWAASCRWLVSSLFSASPAAASADPLPTAFPDCGTPLAHGHY